MAESLAEYLKENIHLSNLPPNLQTKVDLDSLLPQLLYMKMEAENFGQGFLRTTYVNEIISVIGKFKYLHMKTLEAGYVTEELSAQFKEIRSDLGECVYSYDAYILNIESALVMKVDVLIIQTCASLLIHFQYLSQKKGYEKDPAVQDIARVVQKYVFFYETFDDLRAKRICPNTDMRGCLLIIMNTKFCRAFLDSHYIELERIFEMYRLMQAHETVINTIQFHLVLPNLSKIFKEENLERNSLGRLYEVAYLMLANYYRQFIDLSAKCLPEEFNFVMHCFWPVTDKLLTENMKSLLDRSHPLILDRYRSTIVFLEILATVSGNATLVREDPSFINHLFRYNMIGYFPDTGYYENLEIFYALYGYLPGQFQ